MACGCTGSSIITPPTFVSTDGTTSGYFIPLTTAIDATGVKSVVWRLRIEAKTPQFEAQVGYETSNDPTSSWGGGVEFGSSVSGVGWHEDTESVVAGIDADLYVRFGLMVSNVSGSLTEGATVTLEIDLLP